MSEAQKLAYTTVGGTPWLDGGYTVFGEIVEGMEVIDKIAAVETLPGDRPKSDVRMKVRLITE
jgi:cyclophilin family peptidyl-prolyl cis-trans isomerase